MPTSLQSRNGWRSVFVSDLHLGCRHANPARFLRFLERDLLNAREKPEHLYLVGDIIDGWRLRRRWRWTSEYCQILQRLIELAARGVRIHYAPGNHDDFARDLAQRFGPVEIADEFLHRLPDGRSLLVLHGDQVDRLEASAPWLSESLCRLHDAAIAAKCAIDRARSKLQLSPRHALRPFDDRLHRLGKLFAGVVTDFESRLAARAQAAGASGVVCGHIHTPCLRRIGEIVYGNTGDWIRHFSALVEHRDGSLELLRDLGGDGPAMLNVVDAWGDRSPAAPRFSHAFANYEHEPAIALAASYGGR